MTIMREQRHTYDYDGPPLNQMRERTFIRIVTDLVCATTGGSIVASTRSLARRDDMRGSADQLECALAYLARTRDRQAVLRVKKNASGYEVGRR